VASGFARRSKVGLFGREAMGRTGVHTVGGETK
jgi:hypothetical protein